MLPDYDLRISWRNMLVVASMLVIGMAGFGWLLTGFTSTETAGPYTPWRICIRDVHGLLPDITVAVASVEQGFAQAQTHPNWVKEGRFSLPARVSAACQDQPIAYAEGVDVQRHTHFVSIWPRDSSSIVKRPGPYDSIIFILPDHEVDDHYFWSSTGSKLGRYRTVPQEMVCSTPGSGPRADRYCHETTAGVYAKVSEVLDPSVVAAGFVSLHTTKR